MAGRNDENWTGSLEEPTDLERLVSAGIVTPMLTSPNALALASVAVGVALSGLAFRHLHATAEARESTDSSRMLTDEEQFIIDFLREHGGRVRQSQVVEGSSWSKSKVSRLLTAMERAGYIEKVQVGRENAVVLAETSPETPR